MRERICICCVGAIYIEQEHLAGCQEGNLCRIVFSGDCHSDDIDGENN